MKHLLAALLFAACAATASAQTNRFAATIVKALTNDVAITNQTNMTVVTNLTVTIEPNRRYAFQLFPVISASTSSTLVQLVASNATIYGFWDGFGSGSYGTNALTNANSLGVGASRAPAQFFYVIGGTNTNAGTISVQFSSSVATNTNTFHIGSFMRADKLPQ